MLRVWDWAVVGLTLLAVVLYGIWRAGRQKNLESYLVADRAMPWYLVGLSAMATQASAITFLSTTGQGYADGMRFVQFYFGLPLAMVVLCVTFAPAFHRLKVYTAYQFLEQRFDRKTRTLTAALFLLQRGVSTGISIYAPALVLSVMLGVPVVWTNLLMGSLVIAYTVTGGVKAVAYTQSFQLAVIWGGMFAAVGILLWHLPEGLGLGGALQLAGALGKTDAVTFSWNLNDRYNLLSGLIGGFFLQLSYFGTDQSQVQRYLTGASVTQSRMGLLLNGLVKVPMQFFILLVGVLVAVFYLFTPGPLYYNPTASADTRTSAVHGPAFGALEEHYAQAQAARAAAATAYLSDPSPAAQQALLAADTTAQGLHRQATALVSAHYGSPQLDTDYVFLTYVITYLPVGLVGLLLAVIFLASMGSIAPAFNSLASCTVVDVYQPYVRPTASQAHYVAASRWFTLGWGVLAVVTAAFAAQLGNLIEAVNILGSLFYGVILGVFVVAFYLPRLRANPTFVGAGLAQVVVIGLFVFKVPVSYLWYNFIGCVLVPAFALALQALWPKPKT